MARPEAQARADEIVALWDACAAIAEEVCLPALGPREETCWARKQEISEAAAGMSARTLSGIKAKARIDHLDLSDHERLETSPVLVAVARDLAAIA